MHYEITSRFAKVHECQFAQYVWRADFVNVPQLLDFQFGFQVLDCWVSGATRCNLWNAAAAKAQQALRANTILIYTRGVSYLKQKGRGLILHCRNNGRRVHSRVGRPVFSEVF